MSAHKRNTQILVLGVSLFDALHECQKLGSDIEDVTKRERVAWATWSHIDEILEVAQLLE